MNNNHKLKENFLLSNEINWKKHIILSHVRYLLKPILKETFAQIDTDNKICVIYLPIHWERTKSFNKFQKEFVDTMLHESLHQSLAICNGDSGTEKQISYLLKHFF
jgi:hypothetical protein